MNAEQAKNLNFPDLLSRLGFQPVEVKKGGKDLWYCSPFRKEKDPSFCVSEGRSVAYVWKDFGDAGGTVIDFIMRLNGYRSVKEALAFLDSVYEGRLATPKKANDHRESQSSLFSFSQQGAQPPGGEDERELEFLSAEDVSNPVIFAYLNEKRCIPENLVKRYLKEVKYKHKKSGKTFFAFGMENQSGGYEIRAATDDYRFKSALKARDITLIGGIAKEGRVVNIFEGMVDFLSLLVMLNTPNLSGDSIVMHSLSSYGRTVETINSKRYQVVNTFLDNDRAGQEHTEKFVTEFADRVISQSGSFAAYGDLNEALKANQVPDFLKKQK